MCFLKLAVQNVCLPLLVECCNNPPPPFQRITSAEIQPRFQIDVCLVKILVLIYPKTSFQPADVYNILSAETLHVRFKRPVLHRLSTYLRVSDLKDLCHSWMFFFVRHQRSVTLLTCIAFSISLRWPGDIPLISTGPEKSE